MFPLLQATLPSAIQLVQELVEESASLDNNSDVAPRTPSSKSGLSAPSTPAGSHPAAATGNVFGRTLVGPSAPVVPVRVDNSAAIVSSSPVNVSVAAKEDEHTSYPDRRASPGLVGRTSLAGGGASSQSLTSTPLSSGIEIPSPAYLGASEMIKRNILAPDDKIGSGGMSMQPLISPLGNRMLMPQAAKSSDGAGSGSADSSNVGDTSVLGGRAFSPTMVPGTQWRPQSGNSFPNSTDGGQFRGRSEFPPDQREKYLQRFQQVQQGQSNLLGAPHLAGGKQFSTQQQSSLLQQFNSQSSSLSPQVGLGVQQSGLNSASLQQPNSINQFSSQHALMSPGLKDSDLGHMQVDEQQQQRNPSDESRMEATIVSGHNKNLINEDDLKTPYVADTPAGGPSSLTEATQGLRDSDFSPGQPIPPNQPSSLNLGIIGRRSVSDLGAIGDNLTPGSTSYSGVGMNEQLHNLQMLEAAYYKLPTPKDSERARTYIPRHPIATPSSYPQVQAPIIHNPALWERLVLDNIGTDTLFFAFYYQQNTYQQYLAARELKKQSWRYHRKYNTWFQRHENPKVTTDEYEQGTYVYFDFHIANDDLEHGWCQRIKTQFTFEYSFLEDELIT
ncbi:hypothetical protein GIB67_023142 [Kingdonia uniflora]|uniref:NOT2/NOT3/NOT5 C-terminal domain-containing protein n=1 Tax=Kingdonia uniflora TaxID=39325 RepID=A0A7J7M5N5_9MAGN|nr:hypothetical protein GIB67_023142 [Kingdonia uniflora]